MCEPTTILTAVSLVSAGYGLYQTDRNADRQERAYRQAQEEQEEQLLDQLGAEATDRAKLARRERARLRAMSAESGLAGLTLDTLVNQESFDEGFDISRMTHNTNNAMRSSRTRLNSNLNSIEQPDYIGTALNTGLQIYDINQTYGNGGG